MLGEGTTEGINGSAGTEEKKLSINFSKAKTKLCLHFHYHGDESYFYINKTEIYKLKAKDNISWYNFRLESVPQDFTEDEQSEISLNGTAHDFQVIIVQLKRKTFLILINI